MAFKLTNLDLELLGEVSVRKRCRFTYDMHHEDENVAMDHTSSAIGSTNSGETSDELKTRGNGDAEIFLMSSKKREASTDDETSHFESPTKKRAPAKTSPQHREASSTTSTTRDRSDKLSTSTSKVNERSPEVNTRMTHSYATRNRGLPRPEPLMIPKLETGEHMEWEGLNDPSNPFWCQNLKDKAHAGENGVDSEVERGATHLWSMLKTADGADSDVEGDATTASTQTSTVQTTITPQSSQTSLASSNKSKSSFLSTVLNNSPVELDNTLTQSDLAESAKGGFTFSVSPDKSDSPLDIPTTTPKRSFRRQQAIHYDDPDATEDDSLATTLTTPRKPTKLSTNSNPSTHTKPPTTTPPDPKTPPKLCKTTGRPFNHHTTVRSTPRKRAPPLAEFVSDQTAIPTTWASVTEADKQLLSMKEAGCSWEAIKQMWRERTGMEVANSTLPNRYNRVRANLMVMGRGEHAILQQVVSEIEKAQKTEKWPRVASAMQSRGAGKYPAEYLQRQFAALN